MGAGFEPATLFRPLLLDSNTNSAIPSFAACSVNLFLKKFQTFAMNCRRPILKELI
jgi:hypothetical protein